MFRILSQRNAANDTYKMLNRSADSRRRAEVIEKEKEKNGNNTKSSEARA